MASDRKEYHKKWREKNKEKTKEYSRRKYEKFKDVLKERLYKWREQNRNKLAIIDNRYYQKNRTRKLLVNSKYYTDNRDSIVNQRRFQKYGITRDEFDNLLKKQGGVCAICKKELKTPCIDHCHKTNTVRGILCHSCNRGIGLLQDDSNILFNAHKYLNENKGIGNSA
jgi:hypothetical protein